MLWWSGLWDAQRCRAPKGSPSAYRTCRLQAEIGAAWLKFFGHKNFRRVDPGRRSAGTPIMGGARPH
jgi:hypothetical protein